MSRRKKKPISDEQFEVLSSSSTGFEHNWGPLPDEVGDITTLELYFTKSEVHLRADKQRVVTQVLDIIYRLNKKEPQVFKMGNQVVRWNGHELKSWAASGKGAKSLKDFIDKHIVFQLHKKNVRQPGYLSSRMIEYLPEHIEELKLITPWPFIDLSGSLHTQKGFYTGTLLTEDFGFVEYVDALEDLDKHLLSLIPFNSQVSKVRFLSILLSAILRPFFKGPIPAFVILGDRKYSQLISQILLGSKSIWLSRGSQFAEELRKGKSVFLFNTAKRYADSLGESITQSRVIVPTGHGQKLQFQNQTLNIISSKNNTLDGFSEGYYLPIGIENSSSELPSENNRMEIISCCVSLVKQWMDQRGPIYRVKNISAFPEWSQIIGSVLRTIGLNAHLNVHAPDVSLNEKALTISSALKREKVEAFTAEQLLELLTLEEQDNLGINKSRQLPSLLKKCFGGRLIPTKLSHKQKNEYRLLNPQSFIDSDEPIGFMMDRGK